ncbi:MAG TPA: PIG-L deacetylase family protein [Acidimicrobiales bacterium]|nr:PIG-L deacetylase family protein [Acidimicrobiales bacterium]
MESIPEDWERAVAIVAHPDDLEYGLASAIARFTAQGKQVSYLLVTSGEAGIDGMEPAQCGPLREEEERAGARKVGVEQVEFLGHRDGAVEYGLALRHDIAVALRRLQPQVVFGMTFDLTWGDSGSVNHADHRAVGLAVLDACRDCANRWMFENEGDPWGGISRVYISGGETTATHFVDVTETISKGVESLEAHRAYIDGLNFAFEPDRFLREMAGFGGLAAGCEYAVLLRAFSI